MSKSNKDYAKLIWKLYETSTDPWQLLHKSISDILFHCQLIRQSAGIKTSS